MLVAVVHSCRPHVERCALRRAGAAAPGPTAAAGRARGLPGVQELGCAPEGSFAGGTPGVRGLRRQAAAAAPRAAQRRRRAGQPWPRLPGCHSLACGPRVAASARGPKPGASSPGLVGGVGVVFAVVAVVVAAIAATVVFVSAAAVLFASGRRGRKGAR
ncbi:unnamed protein product [Prorocentrum cordatum]|uniref:Uncharacterized protein n=1 Tax=Prorocentrum cordatum TaxID=2364126 RepID=A0ABN9WIG6_9DINO|nr:unnamed protein product [Polarella glacialis]